MRFSEKKSGGNNGRNSNNEFNCKCEHALNGALKNESEPERVEPPRGDYGTLLSFQKAEVIYDLTFRFAKKYLF